jgi:hypothetical protein
VRHRTTVAIQSQSFLIDGRLTYAGRTWRGMRIEGLLLNSRTVQGTFDDLNPETRRRWDYADGPWDPRRNTEEFVAAMPQWRAHGLLSFTLNLQGGSPQGYSTQQPWHNSAFAADGALRPAYMERLELILTRADELGMAPMLGLFYFGQDQRLADEAAVVHATENATDWLLQRGFANVLVEIGNEVDNSSYTHHIIKPDRCHELIELVQQRSAGKVDTPSGRLLVGASLCGGRVPEDELTAPSDFILIHGNGVSDPERIRQMVDQVRSRKSYRDQPVVFNEDDHFDFAAADNNMLAAVSRYASWGYFDYRMKGEGYEDGYQSVPVDWGISSGRKRDFYRLLGDITGTGV